MCAQTGAVEVAASEVVAEVAAMEVPVMVPAAAARAQLEGWLAVAGLAGLRYEDNAAGGEIRTELAEEVLLRGHILYPGPNTTLTILEVDRVYLD